MFKSGIRLLVMAGIVAGFTVPALGQSVPYAYPLANQSAAKQSEDEAGCRSWAQQRTGIDPSKPPPTAQPYSAPPPSSSSSGFGSGTVGQGGMVADGARGAALGAIGGAIAGDAGKGAAIGAASGALFGSMRRSSRQQQQAQWQTQQQAQYAQQQQALNQQYQQALGNFYNAWGACMAARNYEVR